MNFEGFIGPTYQLNSVNASAQRTVNLYPEKIGTGGENIQYYFRGTPGLDTHITLQAPIRGMYTTSSRMFVATYNTLYEIFSDGTSISRGTISLGSGSVGMSDNGFELCVVAGSTGYILNLSTNVFTEITSDGWRGSLIVSFLNGRFYFVEPESGIYYWSDLYDGLTIDPLNFATAEGSPDNLLSMFVCYQEAYAFGTNSIEVYYDSGDANAPLQRVNGAVIEYGCAAVNSIAKADNTIFFLGRDARGGGTVYAITGYQPQRISTYSIEQELQSYGSIEDAIAYTYQEDGHQFYVLNFTSANTTWVYDITEGAWHERAFLDVDGNLDRHRGNYHAYAFGYHYVGDFENGKIYTMSSTLYSDDGDDIKRLRVFPHAVNEQKRIRFNYLQIDLETGVGNPDDDEPIASLSWSNDGGHIYGNHRLAEVGAVGQYKKRVKFNRLGIGRDRVFSFDFTSKVKVTVLAAYIMAVGASS